MLQAGPKFHILLTTYEILQQDIGELKLIKWVQLVVDEGHRLKNRAAKILEVSEL